MNIFASNANPIISASYLDDKRVVKMVLESAQLLSTAINEHGGKGPYKTTHKNHPCAVWCRLNKKNYYWLLVHFSSLCGEYKTRYNKTHKCESLFQELANNMKLLPDGERTQFPNCTIFKDEKDIHKAYVDYLKYKWKNDKRKPTWYGLTKEENYA